MSYIKTPLIFLILCSVCLLQNCKSEPQKSKEDSTEMTVSNYPKNVNLSNIASKEKNEDVDIDSSFNYTSKKPGKTSFEDKDVPLEESQTTQKEKKKQKPQKKKRPIIKFEELVWDFGEIVEGDIVEKKFKFTNIGNAPLQIKSTSATCGCTLPSFPFLDILPGESNVIGVTYNSVGKIGNQNPEITVESNTETKTTILKLQGKVKPKLENPEIEPKDTLKPKG